MTFAQHGTIQAVDYNTQVSTGPNAVNNVLATGTGNKGYGQSPLTTVAVGDLVTAVKWSGLMSSISNIASHQGSSISSMTTPLVGDLVAYSGLANIPTNLTTVTTNRLNAVTQGSSSSATVTRNSSWQDSLTFTHTVTFASGDAARYFFNAGGQLAITCSHPSGTNINLLISNMAAEVGTIVMSAPASGTATIAGTVYNGITRVGGTGASPSINPNAGYYAMTASPISVFTQLTTGGYHAYFNTYINVQIKSNGTNLSGNGDAGSQITIYTTWDEVPNGAVVSAGSTTTVTIRPPAVSAGITNTWGTPSVSGSVSGA